MRLKLERRTVIVVDASAVVELLLDTVAGRRVALLLEDASIGIHATCAMLRC